MIKSHVANHAHAFCHSLEADERIKVFQDDFRAIDAQIFHGIGVGRWRTIREALWRQHILAIDIFSVEEHGVQEAIHGCLVLRDDLFAEIREDRIEIFQDIRRYYPAVMDAIGVLALHGYVAQRAMDQFRSNRHN